MELGCTSFYINLDTTVKLGTIVIGKILQRCNAHNYLAVTSSKIHKLNQPTDTYLTIQKSHKNVVLTPGVIHSPWRLTYWIQARIERDSARQKTKNVQPPIFFSSSWNYLLVKCKTKFHFNNNGKVCMFRKTNEVVLFASFLNISSDREKENKTYFSL